MKRNALALLLAVVLILGLTACGARPVEQTVEQAEETVETVITGTNLLKNAVGTAGMITVISILTIPVIKIWIMMMLLKVTAAFCEPFSDKRITGVLLGVADAVSSIFQMVITAGVLFVISIGIILAATGVKV